jgi:predicted nucleic-acid-binding Zn-ribbon protein
LVKAGSSNSTVSSFRGKNMEEETRACPKCGSTMRSDKHLQSLGSETELVSMNGFLGDRVKVFYCVKCGYIELYREEKP